MNDHSFEIWKVDTVDHTDERDISIVQVGTACSKTVTCWGFIFSSVRLYDVGLVASWNSEELKSFQSVVKQPTVTVTSQKAYPQQNGVENSYLVQSWDVTVNVCLRLDVVLSGWTVIKPLVSPEGACWEGGIHNRLLWTRAWNFEFHKMWNFFVNRGNVELFVKSTQLTII